MTTANFLSLEKVGEGNWEYILSIFPNHIQMLKRNIRKYLPEQVQEEMGHSPFVAASQVLCLLALTGSEFVRVLRAVFGEISL